MKSKSGIYIKIEPCKRHNEGKEYFVELPPYLVSHAFASGNIGSMFHEHYFHKLGGEEKAHFLHDIGMGGYIKTLEKVKKRKGTGACFFPNILLRHRIGPEYGHPEKYVMNVPENFPMSENEINGMLMGHISKGMMMLVNDEISAEITSPIRFHHEKTDCTGPLKHFEYMIPPTGKIASIVDYIVSFVYCFKENMDTERAFVDGLIDMGNCAWTKFDSKILGEFKEMSKDKDKRKKILDYLNNTCETFRVEIPKKFIRGEIQDHVI